jgi:hypoxanthine phosphoribosyltransferase
MTKPKKKITWNHIDGAIKSIIEQMDIMSYKPSKVCGVSRGGLVAGVMLSHYFGASFEAISPDTVVFGDQNTLIVDDIYDTGKTMTQLRRLNPRAQFATLYFSDLHSEDEIEFFGFSYNGNEWLVFPWEI